MAETSAFGERAFAYVRIRICEKGASGLAAAIVRGGLGANGIACLRPFTRVHKTRFEREVKIMN